MSFLDIPIQKTYDSGVPGLDILHEFYIPILEQAVSYDRLAGFFSSSALAIAARGIAGLVANGGRMRLAVSPKLTSTDIDEIRSSEQQTALDAVLRRSLEVGLRQELESEIARNHVRALGWLLREGLLEIRVVVLEEQREADGLFHPKNGIFTDAARNRIAFAGSVNESMRGWTRNIERFSAYREWRDIEADYFQEELRAFHRYWEDESSLTRTVPLPEAIAERLVEDAPADFDALNLSVPRSQESCGVYLPEPPSAPLRWYQEEAVEAWVAAGRVGLLEMATGTGKTRTAIECIKEASTHHSPLVVNVTVPYSHLVPQWDKDLRVAFPRARFVQAGGDATKWRQDMRSCVRRLMMKLDDLTIVSSVHATGASSDFILQMGEIAQHAQAALIVADEVHALGAPKNRQALAEVYDLRLGLSATPDRWFDDEGTQVLHSFFGDEPIYEFGMERALAEGILTPYNYYPAFVTLDDEELGEYRELTRRAMLASRSPATESDLDRDELYLFMRAAVVKKASAKLHVFREILEQHGSQLKHCIVYCMDTEQLESVSAILDEMNITYRHFTGLESESTRSSILQSFERGQVSVLAAMKCLDEGVDVRQARIGIIMASSTNPREFIQRRGRLLRRHQGKARAEVYDIIVRPSLERIDDPATRSLELRLFNKELERLEEFARLAENSGYCYAKVLQELRMLVD